ncbi:hypothetical protein GCM10027425_01870 [Alteromonas gracilis]
MKRTLPVALTVPLLLLTACGGSDTEPAAEGSAEATASGSSETLQCDYKEDTAGSAKEVDPPSAEVAVENGATYTIETNFGDIGITLDTEQGPCAANSFASLAEQGFFDDTVCHRAATDPGFQLLQCGDPTATGTGGPGYRFNQQADGDETYPAGTLAMANSGAPDSEGSQFFLVYGDTQLPPLYTVFGSIDDAGIAVLEEIGANGIKDAMDAGGGTPAEQVDIVSVS